MFVSEKKYQSNEPYTPLARTVFIIFGADAELAMAVMTAPLLVFSTRAGPTGTAGGFRRLGGAAGGGLRFVGLGLELGFACVSRTELDVIPSKESARGGKCVWL